MIVGGPGRVVRQFGIERGYVRFDRHGALRALRRRREGDEADVQEERFDHGARIISITRYLFLHQR